MTCELWEMEEPTVFAFFFFFFFATPIEEAPLLSFWVDSASSTLVFCTTSRSYWAPRLPDSIKSSTVSLISYVSSFMQSISLKTHCAVTIPAFSNHQSNK